MEESFSYEIREHYLYIRASGERNNMLEIFEGTEAFNLVRIYKNKFPDFSKLSLSSLVNQDNLEIARFWESICKKRNFNNAVFLDCDEAEKWLLQQLVGK